MTEPDDVARGIIEDSLYMVLATADATGRPWSSPDHVSILPGSYVFDL